MADICNNISVIPDFKETCWFNAILMSSFYSQEMRKIMIEQSKTWKKKDNLFKFLKTILKNNYNTKDKKILELFTKTEPYQLLLQILNKYDKDLLITLILKKNYKWYSTYISFFLKFLGLNVLDITLLNNDNILFNFTNIFNKYIVFNIENLKDKFNYEFEKNNIETMITGIPDILLFNTPYFFYDNIYKELIKTDAKFNVLNSENYNMNKSDFKDLISMKDEIIFNGHKYKLDSVLLDNYNLHRINNGHAIVGITCNNNHYVYNGWERDITEDILQPCSLMKFDWNVNESKGFCLNSKECKLDDITDKKRFCFNFNKGNRLLVYVKINDEGYNEGENEGEITNSSSFKSFSPKSKETIIKTVIKINKIEIDKYDINELKEIIRKYNVIINNSLTISQLRNILLQIYLSLNDINDNSLEDIEKEYYSMLPISEFKQKELIKIDNKYYLKLNLFYQLFLINNEKIKCSNEQLKELIFYFFENTNIIDIYYKYLYNNTNDINQLIYKHFDLKDYLTVKELHKLLFFIIKIFGLEFFSLLFFNEKLNYLDSL